MGTVAVAVAFPYLSTKSGGYVVPVPTMVELLSPHWPWYRCHGCAPFGAALVIDTVTTLVLTPLEAREALPSTSTAPVIPVGVERVAFHCVLEPAFLGLIWPT